MKLELFYPAKPYIVSQRWGIYNPAYLQFGFDHHNGEDFILGDDAKLYAPFDCSVSKVDNYPKGAGNFVSLVSDNIYEFSDGVSCKVYIDFLHMKQQLVKVGDKLKCGELLGIADNTGFSTGPHTHGQYRRVDSITNKELDKNNANNSFDPHDYWNKSYAVDCKKQVLLISLLQKLVDSYKLLLKK